MSKLVCALALLVQYLRLYLSARSEQKDKEDVL